MTVTQLFTQVNGAYRGSDDDAPTTGTDFNLWLATTNRKMNEWARDGKNTWQSLFQVKSLSPVVAAGTQSYNLDTTLLVPSDRISVVTVNNTYYYVICKPQERDQISYSAYISGANPQTLTFSSTIVSTDPIVGGTIKVGGYYLPADLVDGTSTVPVDNPYWLVYAVASELAENELQYSDKSPDLLAKANNLYSQMVSNNRRGSSNNPRVLPTNVNRIASPESESGVGSL